MIQSRGWRVVVAFDLHIGHQSVGNDEGDEVIRRIRGAINSMLVAKLAATARKDYEQRRERQTQGLSKAKAQGKYQ